MPNVRALLEQNFPQQPTEQQIEVFEKLERFFRTINGDECFVLKGYAGTGKTTIIGTLVKTLPRLNLRYVLLAPTGRAAKVISNYSGRKASTIHKKIYRQKQAGSPDWNFVLSPNLAENTLFIVDEASMIADHQADHNGHSLLNDLVNFVYNGKNCKLMLVGDTAQLPPVGSENSPALDLAHLKDFFALEIFSYELTNVVRQADQSGILFNATKIRDLIREKTSEYPKFHVKGFPDIYRMTGERLVEGLDYAYKKFDMENTIVVCRSNKNANLYNRNIRNQILFRDEELSGGDYVMVVRNNYFWLPPDENNAGFIANGDIGKIRKVKNIHEQYGFRFADVVLELIDYPGQEPLTCKVLLDTLYTDTPALSNEDNRRFYEAVIEDYIHIENKALRMQELKKDPYYNALQIKFSFAITCHKAQGGQWEAVFIDQGYLTDEMLNTEFLRWLYTAATRATKELFLVNFSEHFFA